MLGEIDFLSVYVYPWLTEPQNNTVTAAAPVHTEPGTGRRGARPTPTSVYLPSTYVLPPTGLNCIQRQIRFIISINIFYSKQLTCIQNGQYVSSFEHLKCSVTSNDLCTFSMYHSGVTVAVVLYCAAMHRILVVHSTSARCPRKEAPDTCCAALHSLDSSLGLREGAYSLRFVT